MRPEAFFAPYAALMLFVVLIAGCGRPPQIGPDPVARKEAEALYTAITSRRDPLLVECRARLTKLHDEGQLGSDAYETMTQIADRAESGEWEPAAEALWTFMRGQAKAD